MSRLFSRTKVISIRLSDEEFDQIQRLCAVKGVDSISEVARAGLKLLILHENDGGKAAMESRVNELHVQVSVLNREIARLSELMGVGRLEVEQ